MNITNEIRNKLIVAMVAHAVKKQSKPMHKAAKELNLLLRRLITSESKKLMPELQPERWAELIQLGVMNSFRGSVTVSEQDEKGKNKDGGDFGYVYISYPKEEQLSWELVKAAVAKEWGGFLNHTDWRMWDTSFKLTTSTSFADLPALPAGRRVMSPSRVVADTPYFQKTAWDLHVQSVALNNLFLEVLVGAKEMVNDLATVLGAIRTLKQLEKQFPEALAFLPDYKAPVKNQVADPALISRARRMLAEGIPD